MLSNGVLCDGTGFLVKFPMGDDALFAFGYFGVGDVEVYELHLLCAVTDKEGAEEDFSALCGELGNMFMNVCGSVVVTFIGGIPLASIPEEPGVSLVWGELVVDLSGSFLGYFGESSPLIEVAYGEGGNGLE